MAPSDQATNRADEIRSRRSRNSRGRNAFGSSKSGRKSKSAVMPPVLMRDRRSGAAGKSRRKGSRVKRRYDVALSSPGAEMRLPSLPVIHIGWRLVSGLLAGLLAFTLYTLWTSPMYEVATAEVEGAIRLTDHDINAVANVAGKPIFVVDPRQIKRDLQVAFLELEDVSVEVTVPGGVKVKVVERQPVLAWEEDGRIMWIDSKGVAFPPRGEESPAILVKAENGPISATSEGEDDGESQALGRYLAPQLVSAILTLSLQAPEDTPLIFTNERGLGWEDPRGWKAYFGMNMEDMEMKLRVYKAVVKRLKNEDIRPELISVEYVHAPYYRVEQ